MRKPLRMAVGWSLVVALLLGCRKEGPSTGTDSVFTFGTVVTPPGEDGCAFVKQPTSWSATELLETYLSSDASGEYLQANPGLPSMLMCAGHLPPREVVTVIVGWRKTLVDSAPSRVRFTVDYDVLGYLVIGAGFAPRREWESVTFTLARTEWGWRIDGPPVRPHVWALPAGARLQLSSADSTAMAIAAAEPLPVVGEPALASLLFDGRVPNGAFEGQRYELVQEIAGSGTEIVPWEPRVRHITEGCSDVGAAVPVIPGRGSYFALRAGLGLTIGPVDRWHTRPWYVEPGDSAVVADSGGRPVLRASGQSERQSYGTSYINYALFLDVTIDGKRESLLLWAGDFGDARPSVQGVGDLNRDGVPDVLIEVPIGGYSTEDQLMLSKQEAGKWTLRIVGAQTNHDC